MYYTVEISYYQKKESKANIKTKNKSHEWKATMNPIINTTQNIATNLMFFL